MRAADDRLVVRVELAVAVQIPELDPAGTRTVVPALPSQVPIATVGGVGRVRIKPVRDEAVERADRLADLVDDLIAEPGRDRTEERLRHAIDADDLVLVVAAVEIHAPQRALAQRTPVADGEVDAAVAHLPD